MEILIEIEKEIQTKLINFKKWDNMYDSAFNLYCVYKYNTGSIIVLEGSLGTIQNASS